MQKCLCLNYKNMPLGQILVNAPFLAAGMAVKYCFFKKRGFEKAYVEGIKEGLATRKNCKKVPYDPAHLGNYLSIQWELIWGTLVYIYEFSDRQLGKVLGKLRES